MASMSISGSHVRTRPLIVVAEDGVAEGAMLRMMLEFVRGYEVILTVNGRDALEATLFSPLARTPTATTAAWLTMRPPSRTFWLQIVKQVAAGARITKHYGHLEDKDRYDAMLRYLNAGPASQ